MADRGGGGWQGWSHTPLNLSRYWKPMQSVRDRDRSPPPLECGWRHTGNVQEGVLVNVQEWGCFSIFRRADDITRTMSNGGGCLWMSSPPPSGNPVSTPEMDPPPPFQKSWIRPCLGWPRVTLNFLGRGPSAGIPFSFELKTFDGCNRGTLCSDWAILVKTIWWKVQYYKL